MKKRRRQALDPAMQNRMNAIQYTWRASVEVMMLMLYERADFTAGGLKDFGELFKDYLDRYFTDPDAVDEMEREFTKDTGLHLDEAFEDRKNAVSKDMRTAKVLAIKIGALILWAVPEWDRKAIWEFVCSCWDEIPKHAEYAPRIRKMIEETGITMDFSKRF